MKSQFPVVFKNVEY